MDSLKTELTDQSISCERWIYHSLAWFCFLMYAECWCVYVSFCYIIVQFSFGSFDWIYFDSCLVEFQSFLQSFLFFARCWSAASYFISHIFPQLSLLILVTVRRKNGCYIRLHIILYTQHFQRGLWKSKPRISWRAGFFHPFLISL